MHVIIWTRGQAKVGGERVILIHVLIVWCKFSEPSIVTCSEERAKQPHYSLNYTAFIGYKFLLTYSVWQTVTQWYHTDLPGSNRIFPAKVRTSSYLYFLQTHNYQKYLAAGESWRAKENEQSKRFYRWSENVQTIQRYVTSSRLYRYNTIVSDSQDFWEIKRMRKQWIPGSLFPHSPRAWVRGQCKG